MQHHIIPKVEIPGRGIGVVEKSRLFPTFGVSTTLTQWMQIPEMDFFLTNQIHNTNLLSTIGICKFKSLGFIWIKPVFDLNICWNHRKKVEYFENCVKLGLQSNQLLFVEL